MSLLRSGLAGFCSLGGHYLAIALSFVARKSSPWSVAVADQFVAAQCMQIPSPSESIGSDRRAETRCEIEEMLKSGPSATSPDLHDFRVIRMESEV